MEIPSYLLFLFADSAYNHLSKILKDTINDIAPKINIHIKGNIKPWFDSNIIGLIRKRDKLKKIHMKLPVDYEYFKEQRNIVQREIKQKKANYVKDRLQKNTNNPKEFLKALVYATTSFQSAKDLSQRK